jgi:putative DNA primase/helicase
MNQAKPRPDHEKAAPGWTPRSGDKTIKRLENSSTTAPPTARSDFSSAMAEAGLPPPDIIPDGVLHRFTVPGDRPGTRNGYYLLHLDGVAAGAFGSWKTGLYATWSARTDHRLTLAERIRILAAIAAAKERQAAERTQTHGAAAARALALWQAARPADSRHPYLVAKEIQPHGIRQNERGQLLVPVTQGERLASLQFIGRDGSKLFLTGGQVAGGYFGIEAPHHDTLLIAEGFATAATLAEEIGHPCVAAFTAGNMMAAAKTMHLLKPDARIVICGDNDQWTEGNPGATKARAAAIAIKARLFLPDFTGLDLSAKPTDWNDWYRLTRRTQDGRQAA